MEQASQTILIVDDEAPQRELLASALQSWGLAIVEAASGEAALERISESAPDMVLLDVRLGGIDGLETLRRIRLNHTELPVLLITGFADIRQAVEAVKSGADDYLSKPIDLDELQIAVTDALGRLEEEKVDGELPNLPENVVAESAAMQAVLRTAALVAASDAPVLVMGESGVGKEVIADLIHRWSHRAAKPLIAANCAGLPETLIESELFGHVKGAFTGASTTREGYFRAAEGSTLFLDEIGELPMHLQPKLLRALEAKEVTPVGADRPVPVDVRLVAATNKNLEQAVKDNTFREDLYYRLNVVELNVPPLRDRREDIPALVRKWGSEFVGAAIRLSPQALNCLLAYEWPGNVRELRNAIQRACLLCRGDVVMPEHLPAKVQALVVDDSGDELGRLSQVERATILATLEECEGNRTIAARKLGISRRGLIYKLRAMNFEG
ncbi:sigma-54-dependent transcriptional regulator [Aeoliella mucimassa]|uniref:Transcriptional regulatory protein ZraR n=1 Tax=Aeoliella mucimassa TaxID=2527972 RepID=A0A518ALU5_9BACT|nr:sigma-54 dependent transcriptional regulator [Aeoliella mucimassa]QDU55700.1 Transcriptional regulatory protein ZraR [Aeoliella mucimassa]